MVGADSNARRLAHLRAFEDTLRLPSGDTGADLERLALHISGLAHPDLNLQDALNTIEQIAAQSATGLTGVAEGRPFAAALLAFFRNELGFRGATENYYAAENSLLDSVLTNRRGMPIMLCLVMVAIGRRLGVDLAGLGLPGHFVARYQVGAPGATERWLIDPFRNELIGPDETGPYLRALFGHEVAPPAELLRAFSPAAWAQRILNNLHNAYLRAREPAMAARVLGYILAMHPNLPTRWRDRALLHHSAEDSEAAIIDLRRYFFLNGQYSLVWGDEAARTYLLRVLSAQDKQLFALYRREISLLGRDN
jgi:regulator of sirC expression with transglutaminase-like and TPR domain